MLGDLPGIFEGLQRFLRFSDEQPGIADGDQIDGPLATSVVRVRFEIQDPVEHVDILHQDRAGQRECAGNVPQAQRDFVGQLADRLEGQPLLCQGSVPLSRGFTPLVQGHGTDGQQQQGHRRGHYGRMSQSARPQLLSRTLQFQCSGMQSRFMIAQCAGQFGSAGPALSRVLADTFSQVLAQNLSRHLRLPIARQGPIQIAHHDLVQGQSETVEIALRRGWPALPHFGSDVVPSPHATADPRVRDALEKLRVLGRPQSKIT